MTIAAGYFVYRKWGINNSKRTQGGNTNNMYVEHLNQDGFMTGAGALVCSGGNTTLASGIGGSNYAWQVDTGSGFSSLSNSVNYSNVNDSVVTLSNIPSGWFGYKYRCVVNGNAYSRVFTLKVGNSWTGAVSTDWFNPSNWSCNIIPDQNTNVIIYSGSTTIINAPGAVCRTLSLMPTASLTVNSPYTLLITH